MAGARTVPSVGDLLRAIANKQLTSRVGYCAVMRKDHGMECLDNEAGGQWSDTRSLIECLTRCADCEHCNFATYSPRYNDCAWNRQCHTLHYSHGEGKTAKCDRWQPCNTQSKPYAPKSHSTWQLRSNGTLLWDLQQAITAAAAASDNELPVLDASGTPTGRMEAPRPAAIVKSVTHKKLPPPSRVIPCSMVQPFYPRSVGGGSDGTDPQPPACPHKCTSQTDPKAVRYVFIGGPPGHGTTALYALLSTSAHASNVCGITGPLCEGGYLVSRLDSAHRSGAMWTDRWAAQRNFSSR